MSTQSTNLAADLKNTAQDTQQAAVSIVNDLKGQASEAAGTAKDTLGTMASEARTKINDIVDHQKSAGADQIAGIARAVQTAAGDLDEKNPQVARFVRDAASSVDRFAGDLRSKDVRDVLASVTTFARQQPVAFFAGSVLAGFVLARFLKSDAAPKASASPQQSSYRDWAAAHRDETTL